MPIFRVNVPVSGFAGYEVEAKSVDDAKQAVLEGCGVYDSKHSEYNEDHDTNSWYAYKIIRE